MFIFEILIYVFFAYVMYTLAKRSYALCPDEEVWDTNIKWYIAFFTLITALRYCVGGDYFSYVHIFEGDIKLVGASEKETLWNLLVAITSKLDWGAVLGFGVCGFLQIFFLVKACGNNKFLLLTLPIVMFGSRYFMDLTGAIRQMTAACMFVWFSKYIYERKLIKYLLWVFIASLLHQSMMTVAVFYLIPNKFKFADRRILMACILAVCVIVGLTPTFSSYLNEILSFASFIGYDSYDVALTYYLTGVMNEQLSFGPIMLSFLLIPAFLIYFGPELKEKYEKEVPCFNVWYNLAFIFACLYFLVSNMGHIFIRLIQSIELFQMMSASLLLSYLMGKYKLSNLYRNLTIAFIMIVWTSTSIDIFKNYNRPINSVTYKSILFHSNKN